MGQYVEVSFTVDGVTSKELHDTVSGALEEVVGIADATADYFIQGEQTIWYGESSFSYSTDFQELAEEAAKKIAEKLGDFLPVNLRVNYLEQCPFDDFQALGPFHPDNLKPALRVVAVSRERDSDKLIPNHGKLRWVSRNVGDAFMQKRGVRGESTSDYGVVYQLNEAMD